MLVYMISCTLDEFRELRYIGQTSRDLDVRMAQHKGGYQFIDRLIRAIGIDNFKVEVLEHCNTHTELDEREQYWIRRFNTLRAAGCNMTDGKDFVATIFRQRRVVPESKFDKIYADLKNKIETCDYEFNTFLPSENELTKIYASSRATVRRALAELTRRGYIQTNQGSRVRIIYEPIERNVFKIGGIESFKEAAIRNGFSYATKVVRLEKIIADEKIAVRSGFKIGDELYDVRRVRFVNGKALILDKNYFLASVALDLTEEIACSSIYEYLEKKLHVKIMTSKRRMTTELANEEDRQHLEPADYNCLAVVSGRVFNSDGIQFEYTESRHRPDYFCFEDTATRKKFNG